MNQIRIFFVKQYIKETTFLKEEEKTQQESLKVKNLSLPYDLFRHSLPVFIDNPFLLIYFSPCVLDPYCIPFHLFFPLSFLPFPPSSINPFFSFFHFPHPLFFLFNQPSLLHFFNLYIFHLFHFLQPSLFHIRCYIDCTNVRLNICWSETGLYFDWTLVQINTNRLFTVFNWAKILFSRQEYLIFLPRIFYFPAKNIYFPAGEYYFIFPSGIFYFPAKNTLFSRQEILVQMIYSAIDMEYLKYLFKRTYFFCNF